MNLFKYLGLFIFLIISSCSSDDKAIDIVTQGIERGAILRTIDRVSPNFERTDIQSSFSVIVEEQDLEEGEIFDFVRLYIQYFDRSLTNGNDSSSEIVLKDVSSSDFQTGVNGLPIGTLDVTFEEAIQALSLNFDEIQAGDQFELRAEIHLTDGRTFSTENGSSSILTDFCFFKSPYRYTINVIDAIDDNLFIGTYNYQIIESPESSIFNNQSEGVIFISAGDTPNVRNTGLISEGLEFTIAGNNAYPRIYQSINVFCSDSAFQALAGPDEDNFGQIDLTDDSVFELDVVFGYEGWGGRGDLTTPERFRYRFSKQ